MKPSEAKALKNVSTPASDHSGLSAEDIKILRSPFAKDRLGVKVQSVSREKTRALLVLYLQHTDVMDRLEQVDPAWTTEVLSEDRVGDTVYVRMRMTVKGVSRENVGEGGDPKAAYSDALKRCAMLFGVGRYLYDSPTVWADYNESRDRFKQWTVQEYEAAIRPNQRADAAVAMSAPATEARPPTAAEPETEAQAAPPASGLKTSVTPNKKGAGKGAARSREQLNRQLMNLYRPYLAKFPDTRFVELLQERYGVGETRLMTLEQIEDLVQFMEQQLKSVA